ncbi:MAG: glycosyltransferase [Bacteroidaceae bacterium]|nr:glycosyltransferase [Bacteroidaceae bacterium]
MIVLIRCNDIISDSRTKKYLDFLVQNRADYRIIAWDRIGNSERLPHTIYCPVKSKYNQGGVAAIIDRLKWMWFILRTLCSFKADLHIHACDLDAAFPAAVYKMLSWRKNFLLFDVFDWISDTLNNQGRIVSWAFAVMEWVSVRLSDHIIICEPERISQIPYNIDGRYSVLQNIPSFAQRDFLVEKTEYRFSNQLLTLAYVGNFTYNRCLAELIEGAAKGCFNLNIAGYGDAQIMDLLEKNSLSPHIHFYGKVLYQEGLCIQYNSDIIYAMYSKVTPNHFYAAPNKYYEAMFVGKPIITTKGIITAEKVEKNGLGYSIEETVEDLTRLVDSLTRDELKQKAARSAEMWMHYRSATEDYLKTVYSPMMNL